MDKQNNIPVVRMDNLMNANADLACSMFLVQMLDELQKIMNEKRDEFFAEVKNPDNSQCRGVAYYTGHLDACRSVRLAITALNELGKKTNWKFKDTNTNKNEETKTKNPGDV
jgi:hypothetical protein